MAPDGLPGRTLPYFNARHIAWSRDALGDDANRGHPEAHPIAEEGDDRRMMMTRPFSSGGSVLFV